MNIVGRKINWFNTGTSLPQRIWNYLRSFLDKALEQAVRDEYWEHMKAAEYSQNLKTDQLQLNKITQKIESIMSILDINEDQKMELVLLAIGDNAETI